MKNITNIHCTRTTRMQKLTVFYLLLYPIISIYGWPGLGFGFLSSVLLVSYYIYNRINNKKKTHKKKIPGLLWGYLLYWYLTSFVHAKNLSEFVSLGVLLTIFLCFIFYEEIKGDFFVKTYRLTATIFICYFYIQFIVLRTTGVLLRGVTTLLPVSFLMGNDFAVDLNTWFEHNEWGQRPSSFFTEPAMMVQFLLPLLCIELFSIYKDYRRAAVVGLTIVLLQSGNGLFGLLAIGITYGFYTLCGRQSFKSKIVSIVIIIFCGAGGVFFMDSEMGQKMMARQETILDYDNSHAHSWGSTSAFYRLYRGYYIFEGMNDFDKIVGIGNSLTCLKKAQKNNSLSYTFEENDTYMNNIQSVLVKTGLIGLLFLLIFGIIQWLKVGILGRSCMFVLLVLSFMSSSFFTPTMMILLLIPWLEEKKQIGHPTSET